MTTPAGAREILPKFGDGMVYFQFSSQPGTWRYRARLYTDTAGAGTVQVG